MDKVDKQTRSKMMSQIRSKNTKLEVMIRKYLFSYGYRYRLHKKELPGNPDIVLPKYKAAIFVNGCFWHFHGCKYSKLPETRKSWWTNKINTNKKRDINNYKKLKELDWRIAIVWECAVKEFGIKLRQERLTYINNSLMLFLESDNKFLSVDFAGTYKTLSYKKDYLYGKRESNTL